MKLAIVGSTSLEGNEEALHFIKTCLSFYAPTLVISGGAPGIDTMAVKAAKEMGIKTQEFKPKVKRWAVKGGFKERNEKIAKSCDMLIRIVDKNTKTYGSGWTRDRAMTYGAETVEFIIDGKNVEPGGGSEGKRSFKRS